MILVVAGSLDEASLWARNAGYGDSEWVAVASAIELAEASRSDRMVHVGSWRSRPDLEALNAAAELRGIKP